MRIRYLLACALAGAVLAAASASASASAATRTGPGVTSHGTHTSAGAAIKPAAEDPVAKLPGRVLSRLDNAAGSGVRADGALDGKSSAGAGWGSPHFGRALSGKMTGRMSDEAAGHLRADNGLLGDASDISTVGIMTSTGQWQMLLYVQ